MTGPAGANGSQGSPGPQGPAGEPLENLEALVGIACREGTPAVGVVTLEFQADNTAVLRCHPAADTYRITVTMRGTDSSCSGPLDTCHRGGGIVTSNPPGFSCTLSPPPGGVEGGFTSTTCVSQPFLDGTVVQLNAAPWGGSSFEGWGPSGACSGDLCSLTMTDNRSVIATFDDL